MIGASENGGTTDGADWEMYSLFCQCSGAQRSMGRVGGNPPGDGGGN